MRIVYKPRFVPMRAELLAVVARAAACSEAEVLDLQRLGHDAVRLPRLFGDYTLTIHPAFWRAA